MVNEEVGSVLIFLQSLKTQKENRLTRYHPTRHHHVKTGTSELSKINIRLNK